MEKEFRVCKLMCYMYMYMYIHVHAHMYNVHVHCTCFCGNKMLLKNQFKS